MWLYAVRRSMRMQRAPRLLRTRGGLSHDRPMMRFTASHGQIVKLKPQMYRVLEYQAGGIEDSGARGLDLALGILLDGPALRGSLRTCAEALRLEDVVDTNGLVLFKLDAAEYPHATRKIASWVLLGMARVAQNLPLFRGNTAPAALLLVDEVGALGGSARHLRGLVGRAREAGLAVVLATQGPSDLEAVDHTLLSQVVQDTAWQLLFRQGALDSAMASRILGVRADVETSLRSDGITTGRRVEAWGTASAGIGERVNVPPSVLEGLSVGDAWLRIAPVDRRRPRVEHVRVAWPRRPERKEVTERALGKWSGNHAENGQGSVPNEPHDDSGRIFRMPALPAVPPDCSDYLKVLMGEDILAKCERRWPRRHHELGPCLVWTSKTLNDAGRYGWM
jgi:hypothetical protein